MPFVFYCILGRHDPGGDRESGALSEPLLGGPAGDRHRHRRHRQGERRQRTVNIQVMV